MKDIYVLKYTQEDGHVEVTVYETLQGCIHRIEIMKEHNTFCEHEDVSIVCQKLITDNEASIRLNRVKTLFTRLNA